MAKRSPILGYNHNVRYRGLVFHVQTEDSGVLSPHLFTHLFFTGVIVSTRKLVYDSGSAEDAIKSLMQAQHKAVLRDLRRGLFDDKIDQYLAGTPGLLPRSAVSDSPGDKPEVDQPKQRDPTIPDLEVPSPGAPRGDDLDESTLHDAMAVAVIAANNATDRTVVPREMAALRRDSSGDFPEIEIQLELDDETPRPRAARDTEIVPEIVFDSHTRPTVDVSKHGESLAVTAPSAAPVSESRTTAVGSAVSSSGRPLPRAARPAMTPPQVLSRPLPADPDGRPRSESDAIEVYAPAPPSAELPQLAPERPGQYSQHKRPSARTPSVMPPVRSGAIPPGLGRPGRVPPAPPTRNSAPSQGVPVVRPPTTPPPPRSPTPGRVSVSSRANSSTNSGVVVTRPAVIVGTPSKSPPQRVRKAREDESRGFGQGLISEKSLDEVILAYLSEDADDK